jgi:hypothetical protein
MREVVRGRVDNEKSLHACNYFVDKKIDRDIPKDSEGLYPVHYLVECNTFVDDGALGEASFWFTWTVIDSDVVSFDWHLESID